MPLIQGFGDEVVCAALAAAATPLAIALSPAFLRRHPVSIFKAGAAALSRVLRVLWAQFRLWLLRRAQRVLASLEIRRQQQLLQRQQQDPSSASSQGSVQESSQGSLQGSLQGPSQGSSQRPSQGLLQTPTPAFSVLSATTSPRGSSSAVHASRVACECSPQGTLSPLSFVPGSPPLPSNFEASHSGQHTASFEAPEGKASQEENCMRRFFGTPVVRPAEMQQPQSGGVARDGRQGSSNFAQGSSRGGGVVSPPAGDICSICHDDFVLPCQANCGHWFCAECIMRVWHHSSALSTCRCPICRRTITLLLLSEGSTSPSSPDSASSAPASPSPSSSPSPLAADSVQPGMGVPVMSPSKRLELMRQVAEYNRLFGGVQVSFWQRVLDMPVLLRRLGREMRDPSRALTLLHNVRFVFCIVCMGAYAICPVDLISEGVLGLLGLVDDLVFLVCVAFYLTVLYRAVLLSRAQTAPGEQSQVD